MNKTLGVAALLGVVGLSLGGCASNSRFNDLESAYRAAEARNQELQQENASLRQNLDMIQGRLGQSDTAMGDAMATNAELRGQLLRLRDQYREMEERFRNLDFAAVNPETDSALRQLADRYPDVMRYDSKRGMLRFASDLTFGSGSAEVTQGASETLRQLATVLTDASAQEYDIRIVGHTDSVPVSSGTAQRHPTNTHLSAHRAISVRDVLARAGVSPDRMQVAGWGEHRPAVQNRPGRAGTAENRRVEIFLVTSTRDPNQPPPPSADTTQPARQQQAAPQRAIDPIK